jgi:hypothetical protein
MKVLQNVLMVTAMVFAISMMAGCGCDSSPRKASTVQGNNHMSCQKVEYDGGCYVYCVSGRTDRRAAGLASCNTLSSGVHDG